MVEDLGKVSIRELYSLLDKSYFALSNIDDQSTHDGEGGTTTALAAEIKEALEGDNEQR
jgi:hypothetical protein